ncbi:MAG: DUF3575 domain-containing protein [Muribaculaceae bacterium]|nr:DUF3575 domain-containing protein [Muribaculaceae bacterium]
MSTTFRIISHICLWTVIVISPFSANSETNGAALRTNLLYWLTTTPNMGVDWTISRHYSLSLSLGYNAFKFPNHKDDTGINVNPKLHHWLLKLDARYHLKSIDKGGFVDLNALGGRYNIGGISFIHALQTHRYEGSVIGIGIGYGYRWPLSDRWGIEASIGGGWLHLKYARYRCGSCGRRESGRKRDVAGLTDAGISVIYSLFSNKKDKKKPLLPEPEQYFPQVEGDPLISSYNKESDIPSPIDSLPDSLPGNTYNSSIIKPAGSLRTDYPDTIRHIIHYKVDKTGILSGISNPTELSHLDSVAAEISAIPFSYIKSIRIRGYASPEHTDSHNIRLSEERAVGVADYLLNRLSEVPENIIVEGEGEDWEGLTQMLNESFPGKYEGLMAALSGIKQLDRRENTLRELAGSAAYQRIRSQIYPLLRRTEILIILTDR